MAPKADLELEWAQNGRQMAAVNITEKELEDKERRLRESIAKNYGRIRDVEWELSELQLQLHVFIGPKKHGLELLKRKIEAQNEKIAAAQKANAIAHQTAQKTAETLAAEERIKDQLCQKLNLLVQQSTRSQLDKLEQLTQRLESLKLVWRLPTMKLSLER